LLKIVYEFEILFEVILLYLVMMLVKMRADLNPCVGDDAVQKFLSACSAGRWPVLIRCERKILLAGADLMGEKSTARFCKYFP
jgi:hypothetical protein